MMNARTLAICGVGVMLLAGRLDAQDLSRYRTFELGSELLSVSTLTGVASSEAKTVHLRPALLQDLEWRPSRWGVGSASPSTDPVEQIVFSFYNNQLFRIIVDYGQERTKGLTDADMIDAISEVYGKRIPGPIRVATALETESGSRLARWGDAAHVVTLYRTTSYGDPFRLIVTEAALDTLARKATIQAARLDDQEAPAREIARQKKERDDGRAAAEKARDTNKGNLRP